MPRWRFTVEQSVIWCMQCESNLYAITKKYARTGVCSCLRMVDVLLMPKQVSCSVFVDQSGGY